MSDLRVTNLKGRTPGSAPTLPDGVVITGVATAGTFSGNLTGNLNSAGINTIADLRLSSIADKTTIVSGNSVSLAYKIGRAHV